MTTTTIMITTTTMTMITIIDHHHHHDRSTTSSGAVSVSLRGGELDPKKFFPWIEQITQDVRARHPAAKGILAFKDDAERYVIQGVHMIIEGDHQRAWKDGEKRESRLVFIGRKLDEGLKAGFEACLRLTRRRAGEIRPPAGRLSSRSLRNRGG